MAFPTPSPTLYVSGLEGKTKKPELRAQLYALFTPFGRVIDVVAKKHDGGRGQAFVVFAEQSAATSALRSLTGETFYNKDLRITYAKKPSSATIARTDPTASRDAAAIEAARMVVSRAQGEYEQLEKERELEDAAIRGDTVPGAGGEKRGLEGEGEGRVSKRVKGNEVEEEEEEEMEMDEDDDEENDKPSKPTLICTNLPAECNADIMGALLSQYTGFVTSSALPSSFKPPSSHSKPNPGAKSFTATFETQAQAQAALKEVNGYLMQPGWEMGVSLQ
ncbi:hypothetical protein CI109_100186 [Kwoniella shandongensis]|uniref:Uncharacterized protein n=1 Tax=Kwoniella shandongensis TaxID=1734106 RepID=A0A5M6BSR7_9TREE|nr:uncharacterized protein CI109_005786 [Kwoniella shandongensis]KAA5525904.1 hypothetical protein CI109_005786 [Kwoniella shandongensis]